MNFGNINAKGIVKYTWQEIYKTALATSTNSVTVTGLNGDNDIAYRISVESPEMLGGGFGVALNDDLTVNHYGYQQLYGGGTTVDAVQHPDQYIMNLVGYADVAGNSFGEMILYAKSGYIRTSVSKVQANTVGTTVGYILLYGASWNNTADNITSLQIVKDPVSGGTMAADTHICIEKLNL